MGMINFNMIKKLIELNENDSAIIDSFNKDKIDFEYLNNLLDHGIIPGNKLIVTKIIPSLQKILIKIDSIQIAIRIQDAGFILVKV